MRNDNEEAIHLIHGRIHYDLRFMRYEPEMRDGVKLKRICVFCGSSRGMRAEYAAVAAEMGRVLAQHGIGLVYGGGRVGLIGVLADSATAAGGRVTGVIPAALMAREVGHGGLTDLRVVDSMHERKALM